MPGQSKGITSYLTFGIKSSQVGQQHWHPEIIRAGENAKARLNFALPAYIYPGSNYIEVVAVDHDTDLFDMYVLLKRVILSL